MYRCACFMHTVTHDVMARPLIIKVKEPPVPVPEPQARKAVGSSVARSQRIHVGFHGDSMVISMVIS